MSPWNDGESYEPEELELARPSWTPWLWALGICGTVLALYLLWEKL